MDKTGGVLAFFGIFVKIFKMKSLLLIIAIVFSFSSIAQIKPAEKGVGYGAKITAAGAVEVNVLEEAITKNGIFTGKVKGTIFSVCQEKGCWMKLEQTNGEGIVIRFKDYKFFVPKNIVNRDVVLEGVAKMTTTSVEALKHEAEDAGKSKEEIEKIVSPKQEIEFIATGVLVII